MDSNKVVPKKPVKCAKIKKRRQLKNRGWDTLYGKKEFHIPQHVLRSLGD
jgi:hypothetical protein